VGSAKLLAEGVLGKTGYQLKDLTADEVRLEAESRGLRTTVERVTKNGKRTQKRRPGTEVAKELAAVLKGLNQLNGYSGTNVEAYDEGGFLRRLETGTDPMHTIKGLYNDMLPELLKFLTQVE